MDYSDKSPLYSSSVWACSFPVHFYETISPLTLLRDSFAIDTLTRPAIFRDMDQFFKRAVVFLISGTSQHHHTMHPAMQHYMYHTSVGVTGGLHQGFAPPAPPPIHPHSHSHSHSHHMTSLQGLQLAATTNAMVSYPTMPCRRFSRDVHPSSLVVIGTEMRNSFLESLFYPPEKWNVEQNVYLYFSDWIHQSPDAMPWTLNFSRTISSKLLTIFIGLLMSCHALSTFPCRLKIKNKVD